MDMQTLFETLLSFLLRLCPAVKLLDWKLLYLGEKKKGKRIFLNSHIIFQSTFIIYISSRCVQRFSFSTSLSTFLILEVLVDFKVFFV